MTMTVKEFKPASDSGTSDAQGSDTGISKPLSLEELASRQQDALAKLQDTTSELDTLLEKTIGAVDESISQSKALAEDVKKRATEKSSTVLADAQAQAEQIISDAESAGLIQSRMAMTKVGQLIEATGRWSLTSVRQATVALPGYSTQVEADLRELIASPPKPGEKVFEWRASSQLAGRRFVTEREIDEAFEQETESLQGAAGELKARIRKGFTVVVK